MTRVDKVEPMRISLLAVDRVDKVEPTLDCSGSTSADTVVKDGTSRSQGRRHLGFSQVPQPTCSWKAGESENPTTPGWETMSLIQNTLSVVNCHSSGDVGGFLED